MLHSYVILAVRNLRKRPGYTAINLLGLGVGFAACTLIALFVIEETSYDRHYPDAEAVVRLGSRFGAQEMPLTPSILAPTIRREFPYVESAARLYDVTVFRDVIVEREGVRLAEDTFLYADSTLFDVLAMPFVAGDAGSALARPNTLVLTASAAATHFGDADPIGETLTIDGRRTFEVTGVLADPPETTHLPYRFIASLTTLRAWGELSDTELRGAQFLTYLRLRDASDRPRLEADLAALVERTFGAASERAGMDVGVTVAPLRDLHLYHGLGSMTEVRGAAVIGLLLLLVACINFVNLATARSVERAREVGVRKVAGARRGALVGQFLAEAGTLGLGAGALALLLAEIGLPALRALTGTSFEEPIATDPERALLVLGAALAVGLLSGLYPAVVLSGFQPIAVLKGSYRTSERGRRLRTTLVTAQFAVVIVLLVTTLVVHLQLRYVDARPLGFESERVLTLSLPDASAAANRTALSNALHGLPSVAAVAPISSEPGDFRGGYRLEVGGDAEPASVDVIGIFTGPEVVETLDLSLVAGDGVRTARLAEREGEHAFLLNEEAVRRLAQTPDEAVGQPARLHGRVGTIRGVVRDFHFASLHDPIEPLVFFLADEGFNHLLVRIDAADRDAAMAEVAGVWETVLPETPLEIAFLDQRLDALYRAEQRAGRVFGTFAGLAVLVACLGLFGLAALTTQQRTKEIGVRKVLGATATQVVVLLTRDAAWLVVVAFVVAAPAAYFVASRWLSDFAYRIDVPWYAFVVGLGIAMLLAVVTVGGQAWRVATAKPVQTLRYE